MTRHASSKLALPAAACAIFLASCGSSARATPSPTASTVAKLECRPVAGAAPTTATVTSTGGASARYPVGGGPTGLILGPDRNLWFSDTSSSRIGRLTLGCVLTLWDLNGG